MARIDWIQTKLKNWANWKVREQSGGSGWSSQSSFLREAISSGYRESVIPVDDIDAALTNTAVESLRAGQSHLHMTLQLIYIGPPREAPLGIRETARRMARAESTIKANLDQADHALAQWFRDRSERQQRDSALQT